MGHGHKQEYHVPDPSQYDIQKCPELYGVQQALAAKGLRDPWLRNEAWRYNENEFLSHSKRFRGFFFRGILIGAAAFVVTIVGEKVFLGGGGHGHGHGHGDGHGHGAEHSGEHSEEKGKKC